jgi:hypothetical protein
MINTNVGDMPLDIFSDYISDTLDEEWTWIHLFVINEDGYGVGFGSGLGRFYGLTGSGYVYGYKCYDDYATGHGLISGYGYGNGDDPSNNNGHGNGNNHSGNG